MKCCHSTAIEQQRPQIAAVNDHDHYTIRKEG